MRLELSLERRTKHTGLDTRRPRGPIDFQDAVDMPQVKSDRRLIRAAVEPWLDPADHAAAAAEWRNGSLGASRPIEDRSHPDFVAGVGHDVRRVAVVTDEAARIIAKRLAVSVGYPIVRIGRAAERQGGRRRETRRPQFDLGQGRGILLTELVDAKQAAIASERGRLLLGRQALALTTPAEMFKASSRHPAAPATKARRRII